MEIIYGIVLIIIGILQFLYPEEMIKLGKGYMFNKLEPSEWYIKATKYCGIAFVLLGILGISLFFW